VVQIPLTIIHKYGQEEIEHLYKLLEQCVHFHNAYMDEDRNTDLSYVQLYQRKEGFLQFHPFTIIQLDNIKFKLNRRVLASTKKCTQLQLQVIKL
jgi:hypothetical protein